MSNNPTDAIPLAEAILCVSCNVITRARNGHCPACDGSGDALLSLAKILDREVDKRERGGVGRCEH